MVQVDKYMKIKDILAFFRILAPEANQSSWDNCGIQVAGTIQETDKVAVALEPTPAMVEKCLEWGAGAVITHHPLYMKPKAPIGDGMYMDVLRRTIGTGAWLYAAHTSLDTRPQGPAFWLGKRLKLENTSFLEIETGVTPIEASFYAERAVSPQEADAWANLKGVHSISQSRAREVRVVCDEDGWNKVADAIEFTMGQRPVFYLHSLAAPRNEVGFGEVGTLPNPLDLEEFMTVLEGFVDKDIWSMAGPQPEKISTVAYCGGSGSTLIRNAAQAGADVFITGDMKYHPAVETPICVIDVGHFSLEEEMMRLFAEELDNGLDGVEVKFFKGDDPFRFHVKK
jgi:dinuclear metal center YbgI/SA1388 family protein